ncbi:hypothetical protein [Undibacterium pigrum]|uniref:Trypsin-like peptidase n=1 Tax=Undibacterium pigrum TaxID=401470 RepID=A0A318IS81_9BURK|nr:hypothetical protein [Undibacterium pigrum]PXX37221.1 hypothetical protein DFR42_11842 [Undibacterium pigrum]
MNITEKEGSDWLKWILITSIPLVQFDAHGTIVNLGSGTMIDHHGNRFILSVEHVVNSESTGWAAVIQQDGYGQLEYYRPQAFTFPGEIRKTSGEIRLLDLCAAQVSPDLQTWYEYRTPRGLFDKKPHQIFNTTCIGIPDVEQIYGFSGRIRSEKHGNDVFVSDMVTHSGLIYSHSEDEVHYFRLPESHPGHDEFQGCSGSPIVDFNRKIVALVIGGDISSGMIKGIAIQRILPNLKFLVSR